MNTLAQEIYDTIKSSRITNMKECIDDIVSILEADSELFKMVSENLSNKDILWFNKNNDTIFFNLPKEATYKSSQKLDLDNELSWMLEELNKSTGLNWDNIKYRYQKALKLLGHKDVTYYTNVKELLSMNHEDKWRYINT